MSNAAPLESNENIITIPQLTISKHGIPMASSLDVAKVFDKEHFHVLRDIENLLKDVPQKFNETNFGLVEYTDAKGEKRPMYNPTRDAFTLLAMGFTGKKAIQFKIAYIEAFNTMEKIVMNDKKNKKEKQKEQRKAIEENYSNQETLSRRYRIAILPNKKEEAGLKGLLQFVAFLNNTAYEEVEKLYLNLFNIPSLSCCCAKTANEIISLARLKLNSLQNNFPVSAQPKLELYRDTFWGLIDFFKLHHKELTTKNVENYVCQKGNIQNIDQIQTEEQFLKAIFILYKAILTEHNIYEEEKIFTY